MRNAGKRSPFAENVLKALRMWGRRTVTPFLAFFPYRCDTQTASNRPRWICRPLRQRPCHLSVRRDEARRRRGLLSLTALVVTQPALGTRSSGETKARGCSPHLLCQTIWDAGIVWDFLGLDKKRGSVFGAQPQIGGQVSLQCLPASLGPNHP